MKKIIIALILGILILVVGAAIYLSLNAQKLAESYKPEIEQAASNALDASVELGKLSASIFPNVHVEVDAIKIARSKTSTEKLTLNNVTLDVDTMALLTGTFVIDVFSISHPKITLIKEQGQTWIQGLPRAEEKKQKKKAATPTPAAGPKNEQDKNAAISGALSFALNAFAIEDGEIIFDDRDARKMYSVEDLDLMAAVKLQAGIIELPETTLRLKALHSIPLELVARSIKYNTKNQMVTIPDTTLTVAGNKIGQTATINLSTLRGDLGVKMQNFDLGKFLPLLEEVVPALSSIAVDGDFSNSLDVKLQSATDLAANGEISLHSISVKKDALNLSDISGSMVLNASKDSKGVRSSVKSDKIKAAFNGSPLQIVFDVASSPSAAEVKSMTLKAFDGVTTIHATAGLTDAKPFSASIRSEGIHLGKLIAAGLPSIPQTIEGTLSNFTINLTGANTDRFKQSLNGNGEVRVVDGKLVGMNIARGTLDALKLPFLEQNIYDLVPEGFREYFNQEDTQIKQLTSHWTIQNQQIQVRDLLLESSFYSITGSGSISFDSTLDLKTQLTFSSEFSEKFGAKTKEAKYLKDRNGLIVIPLVIKGIPPKVLLIPDTEHILKLQAGRAIEEHAGKAIDKVLGDKGGETSKAIKNLLGF